MRILLANSTCKVGGVSTFLLSLREELLAQGHDCHLFFFERGSMEPLLPSNASCHFGTLADCLRLVARERIDVVHANNVDWPTGISAVRRLGARLVLTAHKVRESAWTYGWHAGNCDAFVSVAQWIAEEFQPFTDVPIRVIHNGIDLQRFQPGPGVPGTGPIVAWIGRGSAERKRLEQFALMAPALTRAGLRIWVIDPQGPGHLLQHHPDAARSLMAAAEVWEGARVEQMPQVYRDIAASGGALVSTSNMEGLPLTLLEAQACGCIVVAADVRGVRECVSAAEGGVLYPADAAPESIAQLVRQTIGDPNAMASRQQAAVSFVRRHFGLRRMASEYLAAYTTSSAPLRTMSRAARRRHSPLIHWTNYLEERLGVGYAQYEASRALAASGDHRLSARAAVEAFRTAPTMYARPGRFAHLLRQYLPHPREAVVRRVDAPPATESWP